MSERLVIFSPFELTTFVFVCIVVLNESNYILMSFRAESEMNLKLNNDVKSSNNNINTPASVVKEERRRTGRYIAILVGILLFILAFYHAWVRRIPVVASLVVPALIMFVYVAWVLYTASRDKHRLLDLEAALNAQAEEAENEANAAELAQSMEITPIPSKDNSNLNSPEGSIYNWPDIPTAYLKGENNIRLENGSNFIMPIILVNDRPPEDLDQKWLHIVEKVSNNERIKGFTTKRKFKRKFCRRRHTVFKRSYSIG